MSLAKMLNRCGVALVTPDINALHRAGWRLSRVVNQLLKL